MEARELVVPLFEAPIQSRGEQVRQNEIARFVRFEYGDRNPRWIAYGTKRSYNAGKASSKGLLAAPVTAVVRAAKTIASMLF